MSFDIGHILSSMGTFGLVVFGILAVYGVVTLAISIERWIAFRRGARESRRFARAAQELIEGWHLEEVVQAAEKYPQSPLASLVGAVVRRYYRAVDAGPGGLDPVDLARNEAVRQREQLGQDLRRGLSVLASIGSTAPFVGLLGTVLGIINAFQGIAATGGGGLGAVSAGIAEALIETAFGLFVAIPTVLLYNHFMARAVAVEVALERSAGELLDELENEHGRAEITEPRAKKSAAA
jgi:biopolymer transport protein ExbB